MVKVYAVTIKDAAINRAWLQYVSAEKRQRLSRIREPQSFAHSLIGDLLVRYLAVQYLGLSNEDLLFRTNQYGKPYLLDPPRPFHFSLSHSGCWVVCAVGQNPVGVDVQLMEPVDDDFAQKVMTPEAYEHYLSLPHPQKLDYFYELWTKLESFIKLTGKGIEDIPLLGTSNIRRKPVYYHCYDLESAYRVTACSEDGHFEPSLSHLQTYNLVPKI